MKKFSGANFCFWVSVLVVCFLVLFCLCFCFSFGLALPKMSWKILLMSGLVFLGFFLSSFVFVADVVALLWFFFERESLGSHRAHPHTHLCCFFLFFFVPPHLFVRPFWPCVLLLGVFLGVPFWAPRVFGILLVLF